MGRKPSDYDLVVVGGGAAGLGAARTGAGRGARTLLVSDGEPGGDCTFHGCVPSKTLLEGARSAASYADVRARIAEVVATIAATEDTATLRAQGIAVRHGRARFAGPGRLVLDGQPLTADRVVVATGSVPAAPAVPGLAEVGYRTNETVFDLPDLPARLAVLGGGSTGCELAQGFRRLGSEVVLLEAGDRLLSAEEPEASATVLTVLRGEGVDVRLGAEVAEATPGSGQGPGRGGRLRLGDGSVVDADRVLVATGRRAATDDLDLPAAGVAVDARGYVRTDRQLATTADGVYAAGDVVGRLQLTHAAYAMGRLAAGNALGRRGRAYREDVLPRVTFTDPEVASVGLLEADAPADARVAELPMTDLDRALCAQDTDGFVKLIAGRRRLLGGAGGGRIIGATVVAARAGELVHEPTLAMATGMFTGRLAATTHAYPTWSTAVQQAAAQFFVPVGGRRARPRR